MRVAIFHALFSELGGGEVLTLKLGKVLNELGFNVDFYTFELNPELRKVLGDVPGNLRILKKPIIVKIIESLCSDRLVRLRRLLLYDYLAKNLDKIISNYDLAIETQSNIPYNVDISYIHFPALIDYTLWGFKDLKEFYTLRHIYNCLVKNLCHKLCKLGKPKLILTNSSWTARWIIKAYGNTTPIKVLHPAVDVEYFSKVVHKYPRENFIVTVSRFTPEKSLNSIVDLAKRLPNYKFIMVGSTSKYSMHVIKDIITRARRLEVKNLRIYVNVSRDELRDLLGRAKYYLHPPFPEHFGISVVEAMAAGCVPVVYKDGGAWYDIVSKVSNILGYETINEVPNIIKHLEENPSLYISLKNESIKNAKAFNYEKFKEKLSNIINYVLQDMTA